VDALANHVDKAHAVIEKHIYSFFTDEAEQLVKDAGWTDLVFCGLDTESCVQKSAVGAIELGYRPWLLRDATASHAGRDELIDTDRLIRLHRLLRNGRRRRSERGDIH
jgi:nicotinamidase-related amidase